MELFRSLTIFPSVYYRSVTIFVPLIVKLIYVNIHLKVAKTISFAVKSCQDKIHYVILNNISNLQKDLLFT